MNPDRQRAEQLLEVPSPGQVAAVVHVMEQMLDPSHAQAGDPRV